MTRLAVLALVALALPHTAEAATRVVSGTIQFQEFKDVGVPVGNRPVRFVDVQIKRGSTVIATTATSSAGTFARAIDTTQLPPAGDLLTIEFRAENFAANVFLTEEGTNDWIVWQYQVTVPFGTGTIVANDVVGAPWSVHLSLLDAVTWGRQYADARRDDTDDITQVDVVYPTDSSETHYDPAWDEISVQGPVIPPYPYGGDTPTPNNGWHDLVVLHELGHHLETYISDAYFSGHHDACSVSEGYEFSWNEGFPTYFAHAVGLAFPANLVDEHPDELESDGGDPCDPANEVVTSEILYDLHDPASTTESFDKIDGSQMVGTKNLQRIIFEIFDNEQQNDAAFPFPIHLATDIKSFHDAWIARHLDPRAHQLLDKLMFHHGVEQHARTDLRVLSVTAPATVARTQPFSITWRPTQSGYIYGEQVQAKFYLFSFVSGVFPIVTWYYGNFPANPTTTTLTIPATVPPGTYWLYAHIDEADTYTEVSETNNAATAVVNVQ